MNKLFKTIISASILSVALASTAYAKPYKIGAAVYGLKGEFMQMWVDQLEKHPAVLDGTVDITVFDGRYDALTQSNQFDTMITQKFDAILFVPIDIEAGGDAVEKANEAGIPVIGSNTKVTGDSLYSYVGNDDVKAGEMQAEAIAKAIGGKGNIVIMEGPIGQSAQIERTQGNQTVFAKYPDIKILEQKPANWSRAEAMTIMENWLTSHPNAINAVVGQNDDIGLGGLEAIRAKGIELNTIPTAGIDGIKDGIQSVKDGELYVSFFQDAKAQAQGALDVALRKLEGESYQPRSVIWQEYADQMPWGDGTAKRYDIPWTEITKENADRLLQKLSE
ncbi:substrate-binding domain-containing protein [Thorsellia anophelis]|uniref:Putative xylitol transport system substrate-binding protein n=1 Tax=Thorsellia anophelis DSM 18579 TaxID=1123402 RepID=A0A1I0ADL4_9GAMM|nr:substrate-binding domain-containing protein [Thorsellia anophelis]SES92175.1 putative xylitol transport system substrate-binding protein [Thorsellia anophelis DSM 18579]